MSLRCSGWLTDVRREKPKSAFEQPHDECQLPIRQGAQIAIDKVYFGEEKKFVIGIQTPHHAFTMSASTPKELVELVEFLSHGNTQIRQVAAEHLVGYSQTHTSIFKTDQLQPVKDLKLLVKDYPQIAKNALTILINISHDVEVLRDLANDDEFLGQLLSRITVCQFPNSEHHTPWKAHLGHVVS